MNDIEKGDVVRSQQGRDKDLLFYVLQCDGRFALIADGKQRKTDRPKKKNVKHVERCITVDMRLRDRLRQGESVTNTDIRRSLERLSAALEDEQEGI
ncbi:MAG: KOW domain-containing RNA-binding protein [Bacillota bacterium]|nr:KOW domain-containing RNA-binding protein [Bacillota bacterium]